MKFRNKDVDMRLHMQEADILLSKLSPFYISDAVAKSVNEAQSSLRKHITELPNITRTVIVGELRPESKKVFNVYSYKIVNHKKDTRLILYSSSNYDLGHFRCDINIADGADLVSWHFCIVDNSGNFVYEKPMDTESAKPLLSQISWVFAIEVFLQFADVETKLLKSGHEIREGVMCKYKSNLDFPITVVDATWFTTLVHSDAFKVRGHFRLQPYGPENSKRKLIWINEFQKDGYTREAKKLSTQ